MVAASRRTAAVPTNTITSFITVAMTLLLSLVSRRVGSTRSAVSTSTVVNAFSPITGSARSTHRSRVDTALSASFLEDAVSKAFGQAKPFFSTMTSNGSDSKFYTVAITGASGLVGKALQDELSKTSTMIRGKPVRIVTFSRTDGTPTVSGSLEDDVESPKPIKATWNPAGSNPSNIIDPDLVEKLDAIVHLSGENISTGLSGPLKFLGIRPWTDAKKQEIMDSRTVTTDALAKAISKQKTKKIDFIVSSGIGVYGSDFVAGDDAAASKVANPPDESANVDSTSGFLADVTRQWEAATRPASSSASRIVNMRTAVVMSTKGGALAKLYPIFFLGGGGIVGDGQQYFPHISARDMARATVHILNTPSLKGPINMIAPDEGCTNSDFTAAMGTVMKRPTLIPFPAFAVSLLFGEMGEEVLLGGTRAKPKKLLDSGFKFLHPTVEDTVRSAIVEEKNI